MSSYLRYELILNTVKNHVLHFIILSETRQPRSSITRQYCPRSHSYHTKPNTGGGGGGGNRVTWSRCPLPPCPDLAWGGGGVPGQGTVFSPYPPLSGQTSGQGNNIPPSPLARPLVRVPPPPLPFPLKRKTDTYENITFSRTTCMFSKN